MTEIRKLSVFLCHSKEDKQKVRELYSRLIADGFDIWFDEEKLVPGQDWDLEIRKAIRETDVVIACLSNESVTKTGYVQKEVRIALDVADEQPEGAIFIIPTRLENCQVPTRLNKWQWVDLFEKGGYENLQNALLTRARSLEIPDDELLIRAWLAEIVCQKYDKPTDVADKIISHLDLYDNEFVTRAKNFYLTEYFLENRTSMLRYAMLVAVRLITKAYELKEQHKSPESIKQFLLEKGNILFNAAATDPWGYYPKDYVMGTAYYNVKDRKLPMFDEYDGGLTFNPLLFEMTLGLGTPGEVGVALNLIDSAIEEISHGQVLSNYEFIFTASLKVAEILMENQQHYWANLRIWHAAALYDKYPQQTKKYLDLQCEVGEPELVLGIGVYKRIGLGFLSNETTGKAITYLTNIANELEEKGVSRIRGLTHDIIGLCYLDLAQYLESRGGHEQASFIIKDFCDHPIYSHLSGTLQEVIRETIETGLPTQYPIFELVLKKEELKKRSSQNLAARENAQREKQEINIDPKQSFDGLTWREIRDTLREGSEETLKAAHQAGVPIENWEEYAADLQNADVEARIIAASVLSALAIRDNSPEILKILLPCLHDSDIRVSLMAASAFAVCEYSPAISEMVQILTSHFTDDEVGQIRYCLSGVGEKAVPSLLEIMATYDGRAQKEAGNALIFMGPDVVDWLLTRICNDQTESWKYSVIVLRRFYDDAIRKLTLLREEYMKKRDTISFNPHIMERIFQVTMMLMKLKK